MQRMGGENDGGGSESSGWEEENRTEVWIYDRDLIETWKSGWWWKETYNCKVREVES